MRIKIRKAKPEDLEIILKLNHMLFEKEHKEYDSTLDLNWTYSEIGKNAFLNRIQNGFAAIAEADKKPVAYIIGGKTENYPYRTSKRFAELDNIFVLEEYRKQGIGKKLVNEFLKWCRKNKLKNIRVESTAQNEQSLGFYRKMGFKDYTVILEINPENKRL